MKAIPKLFFSLSVILAFTFRGIEAQEVGQQATVDKIYDSIEDAKLPDMTVVLDDINIHAAQESQEIAEIELKPTKSAEDNKITYDAIKKLISSVTKSKTSAEKKLDALFLMSYLLKHPGHKFVIAPEPESKFISDFIGHVAIAIKQGVPLIEVFNGEECATTNTFKFDKEYTPLVEKTLQEVAQKFDLEGFVIPEGVDVMADGYDMLLKMRTSFYSSGLSRKSARFYAKGDLIEQDVMFATQLIALALGQLKFASVYEKSLSDLLALFCTEYNNYLTAVSSGSYGLFSMNLFKKLVDLKAASSAYLLTKIPAAIFAYWLVAA